MKRRYSLQTKITIIFCVAIVAVCLIGIGAHIKNQRESALGFYHLAISLAVSEDSHDEVNDRFIVEKFTNEGFILIENETLLSEISKIYDKELILRKKGDDERNKRYKGGGETKYNKIYTTEDDSDFGIILYDNNAYLVLNQANDGRVIFQIPDIVKNYTALFIFGGIVLMLCLLYIGTIRSIRPLKTLREKIKDFAEGNDEIEIGIQGDDEIAEVINEFDVAVKKIRVFRQARQLFLRNIMHEFKTPIMQGKLSVEMLEESAYKKSLEKVFVRQENLLNRFISIEKLSTGELGLDIHSYNLRDIIDYALDIIGERSSNISVKIEDCKVHADFDMLAAAIKNMLDNALLYSSDKKAHIRAKWGEIFISNVGKPLEFSLEEYKKPFFMQGKKQKESRGLGFGLFISLNIFALHDIKTDYIYEDGKSIFKLTL
ncbi:MAG: ArsS family sensor histidine kinase [Campylobacteraceae bacterium]|jgi:two-component system OmpR family sensor kinase|nr:ArsS family sensor histidine kinase [Campylobacteraceae bacterium]